MASTALAPARLAGNTWPWAGAALLGLGWELAARARHSAFLPGPGAVLGAVARLLWSGALPSHAAVSAFRALAGLVVAVGVGVTAGLWLGHRAPRAHALLEPLLRVLAQVNPFALMSVFLLVFGGGELVKVMAVAWVALWPVLFCTVSGAAAVDPLLLKAARAAGAGPAAVALRVALPAAAPAIFAGVRLASGLVFFVLVAAEMLGATRGLGWLVHSSAMNDQVSGIYAGAAAVVGLGFALQRALRAAEDRLFPLHREAGAPGAAVRGLDPRGLRRRTVALVAGVVAAVAVLGWAETRRVLAHDRAVMGARPAGAADAEAAP